MDDHDPSAPLTVTIAMLTFRRPDDLVDALPSLLAQIDTVDPAETDVRILIIDNDPAGSAMPLAADHPEERVRFVHEPTPGIAAARNRALEESSGQRLLIFVDDDERPEPGWLTSMLDTWATHHSAAVVGPVISTYPETPDPWIEQGGFFTRRRLPTGTELTIAATNNLLLDLNQIDELGLRFDMRFGTSGGSDTLFSRELHRRGGEMIWCDEAVVVDVVPMSRLNRSWVMRRALRMGNSWSRTSLAMEHGPGLHLVLRLRLSAEGLARIGAGGARFLLGLATRSVRNQAKGARTVARGVGMAGGAWGYVYVEYRRTTTAS